MANDCKPRIKPAECPELIPASPSDCCPEDSVERGWYNARLVLTCPDSPETYVVVPSNYFHSTVSQEDANSIALLSAQNQLVCPPPPIGDKSYFWNGNLGGLVNNTNPGLVNYPGFSVYELSSLRFYGVRGDRSTCQYLTEIDVSQIDTLSVNMSEAINSALNREDIVGIAITLFTLGGGEISLDLSSYSTLLLFYTSFSDIPTVDNSFTSPPIVGETPFVFNGGDTGSDLGVYLPLQGTLCQMSWSLDWVETST